MATQRHQRDMQGLLQIAAANVDPENVENVSVNTMTRERREWLNDVLVVDPSEQLSNAMRALSSDSTTVEEHIKLLEQLSEFCEDIDIANDFIKPGGLNILANLLCSDEANIRAGSAQLVATLVQNNPESQQKAFDLQFVQKLLDIVDGDSSIDVRVKALHAVSCLTRDSMVGLRLLHQFDGLSVILRAIQLSDHRLQVKSVFLLRSALSFGDVTVGHTLNSMGMVEQLIELLRSGHSSAHEHFLGLLILLLEKEPDSRKEICRDELEVKDLLNERIEFLDGKEEFLEESEFAQRILKFMETCEDVESWQDAER